MTMILRLKQKTKATILSNFRADSPIYNGFIDDDEANDSKEMERVIKELLSAETVYIERLERMCHTYRKLICDASDPEIRSLIAFDDFPALLNQQKFIFGYYEELLEVHTDLYEFWMYSEDYLLPDRVGQLLYNCLIEDRFDVYLKYVVSNPLRLGTVQSDFTAFLSQALPEEDTKNDLITGLQCFKFPLEHLLNYGHILDQLVQYLKKDTARGEEEQTASWITKTEELLKRFLKRMVEAEKIMDLDSLDIYLPHLGPYLMCDEFVARDYKEGQQHKVALFLFEKGIIMAMMVHKGIKVFQRIIVYDSFYSLDQIELDEQANCFRLKDPHSRLTCYKIICRREFLRSETKSMMEFLTTIGQLKEVKDRTVFRLNEATADVGDREALNLGLFRRKSRELVADQALSPLKTHPFVEVVNVPLCHQFILDSKEDLEFINNHRAEKMNRWREIHKMEEESWPRGRKVLDRFRLLCRRKSTIRYSFTTPTDCDY